MFGVTIRFLSALVGSLATFFLVAHAAHFVGLIGVASIYRVDEFYTLALRPIATMEPVTRQTVLLVAAALVAQALLIAVLFSRWNRVPAVKPMAVERVSREALDQMFEDAVRFETAPRYSAEFEGSAGSAVPLSESLATPSFAGPATTVVDVGAARRQMPERFRLVRAGEKL